MAAKEAKLKALCLAKGSELLTLSSRVEQQDRLEVKERNPVKGTLTFTFRAQKLQDAWIIQTILVHYVYDSKRGAWESNSGFEEKSTIPGTSLVTSEELQKVVYE